MTLNEHILNLMQYLGAAEAELTPEAEAELERLESNLNVKVDDYAGFIRQIELYAEDCADEGKRLIDRCGMWRRKSAYLRQRLLEALQRLGTDKLATARNTVSVCLNAQAPLTIKEGAVIPDTFLKVERIERPDTEAIRAHLEAGNVLSFASIGPKGKHVRIK